VSGPEISRLQARRAILAHQGLWPPYQLQGKEGIARHIRRVGCIQFDPLNVVGRNPELVLQARVSRFRPPLLRELLYEDRLLLDGWDKMMSIYSVGDWPYFRRRREAAREHPRRSAETITSILPLIRQAIDERGPLSSADLDLNDKVDWSWGPTRLARAALESMYHWGELVIHHKIHTRKVYDFAARHLPSELLSAPDPNETENDYHDWYTWRRLAGVGLLWGRSGGAWLGMPGINSRERQAALARLCAQGRALEIRILDVASPMYMRSQDRHILDEPRELQGDHLQATIIAPLDNLLWDRNLVEVLFGFQYRWEVYKPAAEREYGYYVLPVLYGDRFVARFEPGRDKDSNALVIKHWWWEPGIKPSVEIQDALRDCFQRLIYFLGRSDLQAATDARSAGGMDWVDGVPTPSGNLPPREEP
jgi:uncharacterized protein YcaQ